MSSRRTLLVLAAGLGSRYGGLKQLDPMGEGGETVLEYSVFDALRSGFDKLVFVVRKEFAAEFQQNMEARFGGRASIAYAYQSLDDVPSTCAKPADRTKPWGTTHAVWAAREQLDTPFAVVNADDFYGLDAFQRLATYLAGLARPHEGSSESKLPPRAAIVGFRLGNTLSPHGAVARGLCHVTAEGRLAGIEELTKIHSTPEGPENRDPDGGVRRLRADDSVSMNMWGFFPSVLPHLERVLSGFLAHLPKGREHSAECYLPTCVDQLIREQGMQVDVLETTGNWYGVTYPKDKSAVQSALRQLVAEGHYPARLWA